MSYLLKKFMSNRYRECLNYPVYILLFVFAICVLAFPYAGQFSFDASEDTLVAEGDPNLEYYRKIAGTFGGDEFLFLTFEPTTQEIFSQAVLDDVELLTNKLEAVPGVGVVYSILDAPLLENPAVPVADLSGNLKTLRSKDVDIQLARAELTASPLFRQLLVSPAGDITSIRIDLEPNLRLSQLRVELDSLNSLSNPLPEQTSRTKQLQGLYRQAYRTHTQNRVNTLDQIREIRDNHNNQVTMHLGGVPLVASDMIAYVQQDIVVFGSLVIILIGLMLFVIFRRLRWVLLPVTTTAVSVYLTISLLGFLNQPTTVISSNFVSLLTIISISFSIHLIAKYRELMENSPDETHTHLVYQTMSDKFQPCLFTAITTMVAFGSLVTSDILPVRDFGWIMCMSILISFFVSYSLFASILLLLPKGEASATLHHQPLPTRVLSYLSVNYTWIILTVATASTLLAVLGINRLSLGNRFIDYFSPDTEIRQGLAYIDEHLGGTVPMDIILEFPPFKAVEIDESDDFYTEDVDEYPERYWYTTDKLQILARFERFLEGRPEIGKVISLSTMEKMGRRFVEGNTLGSVELVAALGSVPEDIRRDLVEPYSSPNQGLLRISMRIHETGPEFSLDELISDIQNFARQELQMSDEEVHITGMAVLFNDMLRSLYDSQRSTLVFVILATFLLFVVLLKSFVLALLGLLPNLLAAASILAFMGFAGIPLDMMTITIAAIIIGIGVDDAIHYLHRFKKEMAGGIDVKSAVQNSHASIGHAMYYTSATVIIGFSVLTVSNFVPTVYFGFLTALAMFLALLANLTVLPALLIIFYQRKSVEAVATI